VRAGEERLADVTHPAHEIARARDGEGPAAPGAEHGVDQQEGDTAAVIAVQVREQDRVDRVVLDALLRYSR
jgi:hypothetical protein